MLATHYAQREGHCAGLKGGGSMNVISIVAIAIALQWALPVNIAHAAEGRTQGFIFAEGAKVAVISDIDDTLKTTFVRNHYRRVLYAPLSENRFFGMNALYQAIERDMDASFYYVTNAPKFLMKEFHEEFLEEGSFPQGRVRLKRLFNKEHKIEAIRKILRRVQPDVVLFFGDNAEDDILFYDQIVGEFARDGVYFLTFIRKAYNELKDRGVHALRPGQIGFVTPVEIALTLQRHGLLGEHMTERLVEYLAPVIVNESEPSPYGDQVFPYWMDCGSFTWPQWAVSSSHAVQDVQNKISSRCNHGGLRSLWAMN